MPLQKGSSQSTISNNIRELHTGKTYTHTASKFGKKDADRQAIAIAESTARGRAFGGVAPMMGQASQSVMPGAGMPQRPMQPPMGVAGGQMPPAALPSGLPIPQGSPGLAGGRGFSQGGVATPSPKTFKGPIVSSVPGRTDKHFTHVPSGSFVIPADIVSAHGEGNTLAGMNTLHKLFKLGDSGSSIQKLAKGGSASDKHIGKPVPVKLAGGEIVVPPENVHETMQRVTKKKLSLDQAHAAMDAWVINQRKKLRKTLAKLPGPAKD